MEAVHISVVFLCLIAACAISNTETDKTQEQIEMEVEIDKLLKCEVEATDPAKGCPKIKIEQRDPPRKRN